jgi:hypothetical protein
MRVFVSWSGEASKHVAIALRNWLPLAVQTAEPWVSGEDIAPGERWAQVLGNQLDQTSIGILCVTPENRNSPWLLFEAGALGKSLSQSRVVPLLLGLTASDLIGPISQFQSLIADRDGIARLVKDLHKITATNVSDKQVEELFEVLWPRLESSFKGIPVPSSAPVELSDREMLKEILTSVRGLRVRPDERSIVAALGALQAEVRAQIAYAEEQERALTQRQAPLSFDRAIVPMRDRLERLARAIGALQVRDDIHSAALVSIYGVGDLLEAAKRLNDDLEIREYQIERDSGFADSDLYRCVQQDLAVMRRIMPLLAEASRQANQPERQE